MTAIDSNEALLPVLNRVMVIVLPVMVWYAVASDVSDAWRMRPSMPSGVSRVMTV